MSALRHPSYPRPPHPPPHRDTDAPPARPLLPLLAPPSPSSSSPPRLPLRPPLPPPPAGYASSSHIIPAAYPRTFLESTGELNRQSAPFRTEPVKEGGAESKEERAKRNLGEVAESVKRRYNATRWEGQESKGLWIAAERWVREEARGRAGDEQEGLTLVITHANGFTKESWHPTLHRLLALGPPSPTSFFGPSSASSSTSSSPSPATPLQIDEIWLLDDIHHGTSIDLNAGLLGPVHNWQDGARDIINFIQHVLPASPQSGAEQEILPWRTDGAKQTRRKIVGVGHSFGGNAMVQAAASHPSLFHSLLLVEPMCPPWHVPRSLGLGNPSRWPLVLGAIKRRTQWASRAAAREAIAPSPFFATWHDESLRIWESHHLVDSDSPGGGGGGGGGVELATPSWAEACVFTEPEGLAQGWEALERLGKGLPVGIVMAGRDADATFGEEITGEMVWRPAEARNERIPDVGHLIVQEAPDELADAMWRFLGSVSSHRQPSSSDNTGEVEPVMSKL